MDEVILANTIIKRGQKDSVDITPMKLQKIMYLLYRTYLKREGQPLFATRFEAWKYGPVLESIDKLYGKKYSSSPISGFEQDLSGKAYCYDLDDQSIFTDVFNEVWEKYKDVGPIVLSEMTHQEGGAWQTTIENFGYNAVIPDALIGAETWE